MCPTANTSSRGSSQSVAVPQLQTRTSGSGSSSNGVASPTQSTPITPATPLRVMRMRSDTVGSNSTTFSSSPAAGTVPWNTPATRSTAGDFVNEPSKFDPSKLDTTLEAIEEQHNDAVSLDFNDPPTIPRNTPLNSPPPSYYGRPAVRDLTAITNRLTPLVRTPTASTIKSVRSKTPPLTNDGLEAEAGHGVINVALGSPRRWSGADLASHTQSQAANSPDSVAVHLNDLEIRSLRSVIDLRKGAHRKECTEATFWADEIFDDADKTLASLENLAHDYYKADNSIPLIEHYKKCLMIAMNRPGRMNPFAQQKNREDQLEDRMNALEQMMAEMKVKLEGKGS